MSVYLDFVSLVISLVIFSTIFHYGFSFLFASTVNKKIEQVEIVNVSDFERRSLK